MLRLLPLLLLIGCPGSSSGPPSTPAREALPAWLLAPSPARGGHLGGGAARAFSADGRWVAAGAWDGTVRVWQRHSGELRHRFAEQTEDIEDLAFSPDSTHLAAVSRDSSGSIWDLATGRRVASLLGHSDSVEGVAWSPDGRLVATGSWDRKVLLFDRGGAVLHTLSDHTEGVFALAFSPDGAWLASASSDGTAVAWSTEDGSVGQRFQRHDGPVYAVAWSGDASQVVTGGRDGAVIVWDFASGKPVQRFSLGEEHVLRVQHQGASVFAAGWTGAGRSFPLEQPTRPGPGADGRFENGATP